MTPELNPDYPDPREGHLAEEIIRLMVAWPRPEGVKGALRSVS